MAAPTIKVRAHSNHVSPVTPPELKNMMLSPIKVSALNGEMTGTKMRPLSCGFAMNLPKIEDFCEDALNLRETSVEQVNNIVRFKESWMIEDPGFEPGDKLVAVNGTNVEDMDKENVLKLLKSNSGLILHVSCFLLLKCIQIPDRIVLQHQKIMHYSPWKQHKYFSYPFCNLS